MMARLKNSVGIWSFGANATRFVPGGYHPKEGAENMPEKVKRVVAGLGELVDGYEFHYPGEVNEDNLEKVKKALGPSDLYAIALGTFNQAHFGLGSFINPDKKLRKEAIDITKRGIDLAAETGSKFIIWPGGEGYNYNFQIPYEEVWGFFTGAIAEAVDHANKKGVTMLLEHKNSEPAMKILMRDIGMTMYVISKVKSRGVDTTNLKVNMDWQHLIMNGENLAEYASLLASENLLGHQHGNSGWGNFDDDNMVGASFFMQTLELALALRRYNYGKNGERVGFDLFPYTEDQVEAVKRSIYHWEFLYDMAGKIEGKALQEAQTAHDAVTAYSIVYNALGLDDKFIAKVHASRQKK
jgi:xylose isomerase